MSDQESRLKTFLALHRPGDPVLLANVWDAFSAEAAEAAGARALATTSAGVAWARDKADGDQLTSEEVLGCLRSLVARTELPVTADVEQGYADDEEEVASFVVALATAGT